MNKNINHFFLLVIALFIMIGCGEKKNVSNSTENNYSNVEIPLFNADSAYHYVKTQCDFGPRVPNSKAHQRCGDYLISFMRQYADTVIVQEFTAKRYDGVLLKGRNIVASFNLSSTNRILLGAHWDSRAWADKDEDKKNHKTPIIGANDGASGVGVLMEMARNIRQKPQSIGVDIVFFDLEDQGTPEWAQSNIEDQSDWCLGSQHWSRNTHIPFYRANYGILLDMVGYTNARFAKEAISMNFAASLMNNIWKIASDRGYGSMFVNDMAGGIMDDHYWVNTIAKIPMIDIVQNDPSTSFFPFWHTLKDDINCISKNTLGAVGQVCLAAIYSAS